ncbi:MAG: HD domain-containing protein [Pirellulales bacterium]|nr:HD domain-containing protein [Pirellulales bacterium]
MHEGYWRERIAARAAQFMCAPTGPGYEEARQEAMRDLRCGSIASRDIPTKQEIRDKVLLLAEDQQHNLRQRLVHDLLTVMRPLKAFNPQIDAKVLERVVRPDDQVQIAVDDVPQGRILEVLRQVDLSTACERSSGQSSVTFLGGEIRLMGNFIVNLWIVSRSAARCDDETAQMCGLAELEQVWEGPSEKTYVECSVASPPPPDRFAYYAALLAPLENVILSPERHPEKDALYHSLQVFQLAIEERPYDEEFLLAALLHDVGKAIDPHNHVVAGVEALADHVTERTARLIEQHEQGHQYLDGTLGMRARRRLEADPNFEELLLLAECDKRGRQRGVAVPEIEDALAEIRAMSEAFSD